MSERLIDLFTYDCVDRTVRTRCGRHIAMTGPYRLLGKQPYFVRRAVPWWRCVECYAEYQQQQQREDGSNE